MTTQDEINAASAAAQSPNPYLATDVVTIKAGDVSAHTVQATVGGLPAEVIDRPRSFHGSLGRAMEVADSFEDVLRRMRAQVDEFKRLNEEMHAATGGK